MKGLRCGRDRRLSIIVFFFLSCFFARAQRIDTINGKVYFQLKHGFRKDTKNNIYFPVYDSITDMHKYVDKIYITGTSKAFLLKDHIDTASFYRYKNFPFARDKKHVYLIRFYNDDEYLDKDITIIKGADPKTFTISPNSQYEAQDKHSNYYYKKNTLEVISKTMKYKDVGKGFYRGDNDKLYIKTNVNEDPGGTDKWSESFYREVKNVDLKTYDDFGHFGYAKDKNHVYWWRGTTDGVFMDIVDEADPLTFKVDSVSSWLGRDKNFYFDNGRKGARNK